MDKAQEARMSVSDWIITTYAGLFCILWIYFYLSVTRAVLSIPIFEEQDPPEPAEWPRLSVIVAARNEAKTIGPAVASLSALDYPSLEIIAVNDRSTDETGEILAERSRRDGRIQILSIDHLPEKWLGKVYALHRGTQKSSGEWILYTDADVVFRADTLRRAVACAIAERVDHLTLMPSLRPKSLWLDAVIRAFGMMIIHTLKADRAGRPGSSAYIGIGAFNLVKRSALDRTEGFEWLRMEVADDVGLGLLLHRSGAKTKVLFTLEDVTLHWYESIGQMFAGLEKNLFGPGAHYNAARLVAIVGIVWAQVAAPVVALLPGRERYLWILGVLALASVPAAAVAGKIKFRQRMLPSLMIPAGQLLISVMMLRSGFLCLLRGGIAWRGTRYALKDLRAGQRVRI
jgi:hypothetical protein